MMIILSLKNIISKCTYTHLPTQQNNWMESGANLSLGPSQELWCLIWFHEHTTSKCVAATSTRPGLIKSRISGTYVLEVFDLRPEPIKSLLEFDF